MVTAKLISVFLRLVATLYFTSVVVRVRDWKLLICVTVLAVSALYKGIELNNLLHENAITGVARGADVVEILGLIVSALALFGAYLLGKIVTSGKEARDALVRSEEQYRELIEQAADGIFTLDQEGNFVDVNLSGLAITGYEKSELLGINLTDLVLVSEIPSIVRCLEQISRGERSLCEFLLVQKDGKHIPIEMSAKLLSDSRVVGIVRNLGERKRNEEILRESERRFRVLSETVPGVIYLCRNDERYSMLYLNELVESLTGYTREDFLNDRISFVELYHPDDAEHVFERVDQALEAKKPFTIEYRLKHKDGSTRWVYEMGTGVFRDGELEYLEGYVADITMQREALDSLREAQTNYQYLADSVSDGVWVLNREGEITFSSSGMKSLLGYEGNGLLGRNISEIVTDDSLLNGHNIWFPKDNARKTKDVELLRNDGSILRIGASIRPILGNDGSIDGVIALFDAARAAGKS